MQIKMLNNHINHIVCMGRIDINLPDDLEEKFKMEAGRRFGARRGAFTMAIVESMREWMKK